MELNPDVLLPLDGMLVHYRFIPIIKFSGTHLYTRMERSAVMVKHLAQAHITLTLAKA